MENSAAIPGETVYCVASFETTSAAIETQKRFKDEGIRHSLMPTPRSVQASCGLSVRFDASCFAQCTSLIRNTLEPGLYHFYAAVKTDGTTIYRSIE